MLALFAGLAVIALGIGIWLLVPSPSVGKDAEGNRGTVQQQTSDDPKEQTADQKPEQKPLPPADEKPGEDPLFSLIERDQLNYFRVGEAHSYWDYHALDKMFFSDPNANLFVSLKIPPGLAVKQEDYQALRKGIRVQTAAGMPVAFTVDGQDTRGDEDQQVVIHLEDAPKEALQIGFTSKDGKRNKVIRLQYTEGISYTVRSEQDAGLAKAFRLSYPDGVSMPRRIALTEPYRVQIDFSADMDRSSVEQVLSKQLAKVKRTLQWTGNRSLQLTLEFTKSNLGDTYLLSMSGARSVQGLELKLNEHVIVIPVQQIEVKSVDLLTHRTSTLFTGLDSFETLSVSPNGQWRLKGEHVENQLYAEQVYELTDSQGKIIRSFDYAEVGYPVWLKDGDSLLYMKDTLKRQEVWLFNAATGEERLFWKVPAADTADASKQQRIVAVAADPFSGQIAIGSGAFNEQAEISVYVQWFASAKETKPGQTFENLSRYTCYEGPCTAWIEFISTGKLYFTTMNSQAPQAYPEAYVLDTATGDKKKIEHTVRPAGYSEMRQVIPGRDHGVYLRVDQQESGREAWKVYNMKTDESSEWVSGLKLLKQAPFSGFHLGADGRIIFFAKDSGWFAVDPLKKTVIPYTNELLPGTNELVRLYGSDGNRLWFGTPTTR
jgi:hypothetical protein